MFWFVRGKPAALAALVALAAVGMLARRRRREVWHNVDQGSTGP